MPGVRAYLAHAIRCPYLYCAIYSRRSEPFPIGGPGYSANSARMTTVGRDFMPGHCIPDLYCPIIASRSDVTTVKCDFLPVARGAGYGMDCSSMAMIGSDSWLLKGEDIPIQRLEERPRSGRR